jgi:hypothetical protein
VAAGGPAGAGGTGGIGPGGSGNAGADGAGGAATGGGLANSGTLAVTNSTFAGNSASDSGGGISNDGTLTLVNATIAYNTVAGTSSGGGLSVSPAGTATLDNTIVALNTGAGGPDDIAGTVSPSSAYNLIGTGGSGGLTNSNGNQVGVENPVLGTLADNGGPTQTIALLPGSPAIGAGSSTIPGVAVPTTDQRGVPRPSTSIDIGAFQDRGFTLTIVAGSSPQFTKVNTPFPKPLAVTVFSPYGDPVAGGVISFAVTAASNGAAATLSASEATISAGGQASVTAIANGTAGGYRVTASATGVRVPARFTLKNIAARGGTGSSMQAAASRTIAFGLGIAWPDLDSAPPWPAIRRAPLTHGLVKVARAARALAAHGPARYGYAPVADRAGPGLWPTFSHASLERQLPPKSRADVRLSSRGHP